MPISTAGSNSFSYARFKLSGFTLVELLVVLAIMAFATLAVAPSLQRLVAPRPPRPVAEQLLDAIARSRDDAIQKRHTFRGLIDPGNRLWQDSEGQVLYQFPEDTLITSENGTSADPIPCVFRPDGSGCSLSLRVVQDDQEWRVMVDPVTGRIRLLRFSAQ